MTTTNNTSTPSNPSNPSDKPKFKFRRKKEYVGPKGEIVSGKYMREKNMARQYITDKFVPKAQRLAADLLKLRTEIIETLRAYSAWNAETYGVKIGTQGNISVTSFDSKTRVELHSHPTVEYSDEAIAVAKELMGQVIDDNTTGITQVLKDLFMEAFTPKKQGLSLVSITTLMTYDIPDERWKTAVKALEEGREVVDRSFYIEVSVRNDQNKFVPIPLDISKV